MMYLKVVNEIYNNTFSTIITVDSFGSEDQSDIDEQEMLINFPTKIAYRNLKFSKNIKMNGTVPEVTDEEADDINIISITLPPLSNKEILLDKDFEAVYRINIDKIPNSAINNLLNTKELVAQAYCTIFEYVICEAVNEAMDIIRVKAPSFEGEKIVPV